LGVASLCTLAAVGAVTVAPATAAAPAHGVRQTSAPTGAHHARLRRQLHADLEKYLTAFRTSEHVSAAALTVSMPGHRRAVDVGAGTMRFGGGRPVSRTSMWQIGSNTKAFTSVLLLQLEAMHRLSINDTLGKWLPQYPQWRRVTIKSLLNMTSGIPAYDNQSAFWSAYAAHPYRNLSPRQLVKYAERGKPTTGYSYSNTNYILAGMIIAKAGHRSFAHQLETRIIKPLHLRNLSYRADYYPRRVTRREPAGYFFTNQIPEFSRFMGRDVSRQTLSYGQAAGGIIATTRDMTIWERALYRGRLLPAKQQGELLSLVSKATGKPIKRTSLRDPDGYGLGVGQGTNTIWGTFWFYEGATLGFRTLHLYFPRSGVIMAMGLNSQPSQDHIADLAALVYNTLVSDRIIAGATTT
jgi:D-alanyl-D-alanine carboxypeptidase